MNAKLKNYLQKFRPATMDKAVLDDLRQEMKEAVPEIADSIRKREQLAAELRTAAYRPYHLNAPEFFDIKGSNNQEFGFAWVCVNDARETIKDVKLRGLLLKKLGFSISDRRYLEPFFGRPTYSRRITGEAILTNERLIPNAARSDFEHNSTRQDFITQLPRLTS